MFELGNRRYAGLQSLVCALIGIGLSIVLGQVGYGDISLVAGLILSVTLMLIVVGWPSIKLARVWALIFALTMLHLFCAFWFFPYHNFKPIMLLPFGLIEVSAYIYAIDRMTRSH